MKKYILMSLMLLAVLSCQKEDYVGVQKSSFPGVTNEIGKDEPGTAFNQDNLQLRLVIPVSGGSPEYAEALSAIGALSTENSDYTATVYFGTVNGDKGDFFTIDEFVENDILGTMNGLVKWMNSYAERENLISAAVAAGGSSDAEATIIL